jgi:hypothetical protein
MMPFVTFAQLANDDPRAGAIGESMGDILTFIDGIVIPFILGIGFLVFVWGMFQYFIRGGANDEAKESGKSLIMYAIAGYVVILAFWGIVNIISGGIGLEGGVIEAPSSNFIE